VVSARSQFEPTARSGCAIKTESDSTKRYRVKGKAPAARLRESATWRGGLLYRSLISGADARRCHLNRGSRHSDGFLRPKNEKAREPEPGRAKVRARYRSLVRRWAPGYNLRAIRPKVNWSAVIRSAAVDQAAACRKRWNHATWGTEFAAWSHSVEADARMDCSAAIQAEIQLTQLVAGETPANC
jgi:hypothetical protein